jgi:tetratricopeptide (TPR) repeat protein
MSRLSEFLRPRSRRLILAAVAVTLIAGIALGAMFAVRRWHHEDPLLTTPKLALEALSAHALYYNGPARPWLLKERPELLSSEDKDDPKSLARSFAQAVEDPKLFRQLDRQHRFDTLFLVGDPSQYHPLLEHLLEAKDWTLVYLDHTSLIFKRDASAPWTEAKLDAVRARLAQASVRERATFLAEAARKLLAVQQPVPGKELADEAVALDPKLPHGWGALSQYHLDRGEWNAAVSDADRALDLEADFLPALASKAQALYATKHFADAFHVSEKLIEKMPDDPGLLFYHAKICHEARAFGEEIKALNKLIAMAEENHRPSSGYRVYLAQAYARSGDGVPALEEYEKALADPDLPADQRTGVKDQMALVRSKMGKK